MIIAVAVQRLAFDKLHHEIGQAVIRGTAIQKQGNVWMVQSSEYLALFAKAPQNKIGIHAPLDQLDRDSLVEFMIDAQRFIDSPHAAASNFALDAISAQATPDHRIDVFSSKRFERLHPCFTVQG